jgi:hypothetical protein
MRRDTIITDKKIKVDPTPIIHDINNFSLDGNDGEDTESSSGLGISNLGNKIYDRRRFSIRPKRGEAQAAVALIVPSGVAEIIKGRITDLVQKRAGEIYIALFDAVAHNVITYSHVDRQTVQTFVHSNPEYQTPNAQKLYYLVCKEIYLPHKKIDFHSYPINEISDRSMIVQNHLNIIKRYQGESFSQFAQRMYWFVHAFNHLNIPYDDELFCQKFHNYIKENIELVNAWVMAKRLLSNAKKSSFIDHVKEFESLLKDYPMPMEKLKLEKDSDQQQQLSLYVKNFTRSSMRYAWP